MRVQPLFFALIFWRIFFYIFFFLSISFFSVFFFYRFFLLFIVQSLLCLLSVFLATQTLIVATPLKTNVGQCGCWLFFFFLCFVDFLVGVELALYFITTWTAFF